jgi:hypothetical protein
MDDEFKKIIRIILKPSTVFVLDKDIILLKNKEIECEK